MKKSLDTKGLGGGDRSGRRSSVMCPTLRKRKKHMKVNHICIFYILNVVTTFIFIRLKCAPLPPFLPL